MIEQTIEKPFVIISYPPLLPREGWSVVVVCVQQSNHGGMKECARRGNCRMLSAYYGAELPNLRRDASRTRNVVTWRRAAAEGYNKLQGSESIPPEIIR